MVSSVVSANGFGDFNVWPPGFRFHPTDEELVLYYLKRKICHKKLKLNIIAETDVYKWEPEELPGLSILKTGDRQWFFFSPRDRKYPNGARSNRGTKHGYWKATGKDRTIVCNSRNVGVKKTLVFYKGRAPNGERTDWIMHEYTLDEEELKRCQNVKEYYALYKVYKKSGPGPKNGEQYGALFREEDWADDECPDFNCPVTDGQVKIINGVDGNTKLSCEVQSSLKLIEEFMNQIAEEPMLDLTPMSNDAYNVSQVLSEKEAQSTLVNSSSKEIVISEPLNWSWSEQCNEQSNFGLTHSALSPLQSLEGPKVTSSPNVNEREVQISQSHVPSEEDFLEIDDLIGPEPTLENMDKTLNSLQYEDGLSELDFFHDAFMFLQDIGPIDQAEISQPYVNSPEQNVANQLCYHTQYNQDDACLVNDIPYSEVGDTINNQPYPPAANEVNNQLYLGGEAQINSQLYSGGAAQINSQLYSGGAAQINSQFYTQTANQVNSQFYSGGTDQINSQLYPQTANVVNLQSYSGGAAQINSHLYLQSTNEVNSQLYSNCAAQINNQHSLDFQEWNGFNSAGFDHDSSYNTTSGVVCDVPNLQTGLNENQSRSNGSGSPSRLSSALWVFLETIPTTPASAATESAFVNRALERLSSFSRAKVNARNINNINIAAVTNAETTKRKAGRKRRGFFFFPVLVAVCAILWVIIGTVRQWGISISF